MPGDPVFKRRPGDDGRAPGPHNAGNLDVIRQAIKDLEDQDRWLELNNKLKEPLHDDPAAKSFIDAAIKRVARNRILRHWQQAGGPGCAVGLPMDSQFPVTEAGGVYQSEFRGGNIQVNGFGDVVMNATNQVVVVFEGYCLEQRQESEDELFGSIHVQVGVTDKRSDHVVNQQELGPEENNRIAQLGTILYEGPPANINIFVAMVEHDSGDRDKVRDEIAGYIKSAMDYAQSVAAGMLGAPTGSPEIDAASAALKESKVGDQLIEKAKTAGANWLAETLGTGDDPYDPAAFVIYSNEMRDPPPMLTYRFGGDPRMLPYNKDILLKGKDDGRDQGVIRALFSIRKQ